MLKVAMKRISKILLRRLTAWLSRPRPQAFLLPLVADNGAVVAGHQPSLHKTLAISEKMTTRGEMTVDVLGNILG